MVRLPQRADIEDMGRKGCEGREVGDGTVWGGDVVKGLRDGRGRKGASGGAGGWAGAVAQ
jgi:hypothetical protein